MTPKPTPSPTLSLTLPYPPSVNHYWRHVGHRTLISREGRQYKQLAALAAHAHGIRPLAGPVALTVTIYRPRRSGDLDNYLKALLDALHGITFADDAQIVEIHAYRDDDKLHPRVELSLWTPQPGAPANASTYAAVSRHGVSRRQRTHRTLPPSQQHSPYPRAPEEDATLAS